MEEGKETPYLVSLGRQSRWQRARQCITLPFLACFGFLTFGALLLVVVVETTLIKNMLQTSVVSSAEGSSVVSGSTIITDCGSTPEEARAAGCHFDAMNFGWFPSQCWDAELYHEVAHGRNWTWTTMDNSPVSMLEAETGNHAELLTTWDFHLIHCVYAWRKFTRAVLKGNPLDEWSARYMHAKHCGHELLEAERFAADAMVTRTIRWYPKCGLDQQEMVDMLTMYKDGDETGESHKHNHAGGHETE